MTKHNYVNLDEISEAQDGFYNLFLCVLNVGGGIRRPFYAEYVKSLVDTKGPMARYVMRVTSRSLGFQGGESNDIVQHTLPLGDYVLYAQEIVDYEHIQD